MIQTHQSFCQKQLLTATSRVPAASCAACSSSMPQKAHLNILSEVPVIKPNCVLNFTVMSTRQGQPMLATLKTGGGNCQIPWPVSARLWHATRPVLRCIAAGSCCSGTDTGHCAAGGWYRAVYGVPGAELLLGVSLGPTALSGVSGARVLLGVLGLPGCSSFLSDCAWCCPCLMTRYVAPQMRTAAARLPTTAPAIIPASQTGYLL